MKNVIIKTKELKDGVRFRILKDNKFFFADIKFNNYFYIKKESYVLYMEDLWKTYKFALLETEVIGNFARIKLKSNWMRNKIRMFLEDNGVLTFEADILANKRFLLDKNPPLYNEMIPYLFYDIETDDRKPLQKDERGNIVTGNAKILSFSAKNCNGETFYIELKEYTDEAEKEMLTNIMKLFFKYGIISGWNSDRFDKEYIKQRCDAVGVNHDIMDYINHIDYLELYKKYDKKSLRSFSLNNVSNIELNQSKIDQAKGNGAIYNTWMNDKEQLKKYNEEDSNLVYKINKKLSFIEVSMKRANKAGCHLQNTMNNSDSGDYLLLRQCIKDNIIMNSKPTKDEVEIRKAKYGKIGGGYTTCLKPGFWDRADIMDFKSEYPSIIQTFNIDPCTFVSNLHDSKELDTLDYTKFVVTPSDFENGIYHPHRVFHRKIGIVPKVVKALVEERDKIKYSMKQYKESEPDKFKALYLEQYALKTDGNSIFGVMAFPASRWFNWDVADAITTSARATLKKCFKKIEEWGGEAIGGDTDSTFIIRHDLTIEDINKRYIEFLDDWCKKWHAIENKLVFEYEKSYEPMLFVKKKNYAALDNGEVIIKGMAAIKADSNPLAALIQREFIEDVLYKRVDTDAWQIKVDKLYIKVFDQNMTSEELLLSKALTKMPKDYEGCTIDKKTGKPKVKVDGTIQMKAIPAHVKLAERQMKAGIELYPGSKIRFIVIANKPILAISKEDYEKGEGLFLYKSKKLGEIEFEFDGTYDAPYYWLRIIKPLLKVAYCYYQGIPEWSWQLSDSVIKKIID